LSIGKANRVALACATVVALALDGKVKSGAPYELGGPGVRSLREIMAFVLAVTERRRLLVPIPFGLAKLISPRSP